VYADSLNKYAGMVNNDSLICNDKYRLAAYYYNKFTSGAALSKSNEFGVQFNNALKNFTGQTRQMVLFDLMKQYIKSNVPGYDDYYNKFNQIADGSVYRKYLDSLYFLYNSKVTEKALSTTLYDLDDKSLTLASLLAANKGKVIYIDFWASWCVPCKAEFYFSEKMIGKFKDSKVSFIFLSFDKVKENWKKGSAMYDFLNRQNSYLVNDEFSSQVAKEYNILSIPRYMLINADGKMIDIDAKRPSDTALATEIDGFLQKGPSK